MRKMIEVKLVMMILRLSPHHQNAVQRELILLTQVLLAVEPELLKEALPKELEKVRMRFLLLQKPVI